MLTARASLDSSGRSTRVLEELQALDIAFVLLNEGIDATTPAGKVQMRILGALVEFERARIVEWVNAGLMRARAAGKRLGAAEEELSAIGYLARAVHHAGVARFKVDDCTLDHSLLSEGCGGNAWPPERVRETSTARSSNDPSWGGARNR
jgi:resolvase-like protein